jgi:signal transduction histidine kinase
MKKVRKKKLIHKLLLFVLPLSAMSVVATAAVLSWNNYNHHMSTIDRDYRNIIRNAAGEVQLYIESGRQNLESLARLLTATKLDPWRQEMALKAFNQKGLGFLSIRLLTPEGAEITSTGWVGGDGSPADSPIFRMATEGSSSLSEIMLTRENMPFIHLGVPVRRLGEVAAVLWSELNLKAIWDVMEGIVIGETGQVYVMNASGEVIVDRNIAPVPRNPSGPKTDQVMERLAGSLDTVVAWEEERGDTMYHCLGYMIPNLQWVVVVSQSEQEIHHYLYRNMYWAAIISIFVCFLSALLGWRQVRKFIQPIDELHRQVRRIGEGELDQKVQITTRDEIGDLGEEFNRMTDSLRQFIAREVESARELLHARNLAVLGAASSKVTHEVGNLLSNIQLGILTLRREQLGPQSQRAVKILEKEALRVRAFIQDFLQFAKKPDLRMDKSPLINILQEIAALHGPQAEQRGTAIRLEWSPELPPVNVDLRLLYQVLNNLVKNSLEAMADPGIITIRGAVQGDYLQMIVEDTGPGIEAAVLPRIFEPFFTTKGSGGTGLGLSICKSIVEAHGGTLECFSEQEKGTVFVLSLPR